MREGNVDRALHHVLGDELHLAPAVEVPGAPGFQRALGTRARRFRWRQLRWLCRLRRRRGLARLERPREAVGVLDRPHAHRHPRERPGQGVAEGPRLQALAVAERRRGRRAARGNGARGQVRVRADGPAVGLEVALEHVGRGLVEGLELGVEERHELRRDLVLPPLERVELRQRRVQVADELPDPGAALDDVGVGAGGRLEVRQRPLRRRDVAREVRRARGRRRENAARLQVPERRAAQELDAARGERGLARAERRRVRRRRRQAQRPVERRVPPVVLHRARVARSDAHRPRAAGGAHRRGRRLDDAPPLVARDLLGPVQQRRVGGRPRSSAHRSTSAATRSAASECAIRPSCAAK